MASNVDGAVVLEVNMDIDDAEKELARLKSRVFKLEEEISEKEYNRNELVQQRKAILSEISELQNGMKLLDGDAWSDNSAAEKKIAELTKQAAELQKEIEGYDSALGKSTQALDYTKVRYGEILQIADDLKSSINQSSISGKVKLAQMELEALSRQGKGLGDADYDAAYRNLALLTNQAREYQKELSKTPEQIQREANAAQKKAEAEAKTAQAERERQEAEQRLIDIKENAAVVDQRIVDLQEELVSLAARRKELEAAGVGIGYEEYDKVLQRTSEINNELQEYQNNLLNIEPKTKKAAGATERLGKRIKELLASAFIFNILSNGLRQFTTWVGKAVKTNSEARASMAQLKAALLTLAQPLVEVIIPAFTAFVNVLARIITAIAQLVSMLFGKTLKQSKDGAKALYNEANAIEGVGAAAEEAAGSLAGFDEINTINTEDTGGGGGGAGASEEIAPDFSWMGEMGGMLDRLKEIADLVGLIAAGLALWKISEMLPGVLGTIAQKLAGLLLTIGGLLLLWHGLTDAWENGVDWLNLIEMIGGLAAAALGLYLLFGPIAAGIMLIVGGLALLVTGFHDAMENGWNLQNTLLSIAGILATGLGLAIITNSWIPLLIAGIASVLLALTVATGHGEELIEGVRTILEGFSEFFSGVFSGDIEKAIGGIEKIFDGLQTSVFAVLDGVKDSLLSFLDWLDEKTGGRFHGVIETAKGFVTGFFDGVETTLGNILDAVKQIFTGITQFIGGVFTNDWDLAWEGIQNIFKGAWNGIVSLIEGAVNLIIRGLNWLISQMNKISFTVPSWVPGVGGKSLGISIPSIPEAKIPRLAQGAVIPPNREFMAVLGDQTSGNNLEAPEDLIRKIVREESGGGKAELAQLLQAILQAIKDGHILMVDGTVFGRTAIRTINSANTAAGKQLLLI